MRSQTPKALASVHAVFRVGHFIISLLFISCGAALIGFGCWQLWGALSPGELGMQARVNSVMESLAIVTVALAALELGQTILEEEVQREADMSAPTRVRRFLSRFMVVLVVALSIETLVLVFRFSQESPEHLTYAAVVGFAAAALIIAWGVFVRLNRYAEELEPEALREAKSEDKKVRG